MSRIEKPVARLSGSSPAVLHACDAPRVKLHRAGPLPNPTQSILMQHREPGEYRCGNQQEPKKLDEIEKNNRGSNGNEGDNKLCEA